MGPLDDDRQDRRVVRRGGRHPRQGRRRRRHRHRQDRRNAGVAGGRAGAPAGRRGRATSCRSARCSPSSRRRRFPTPRSTRSSRRRRRRPRPARWTCRTSRSRSSSRSAAGRSPTSRWPRRSRPVIRSCSCTASAATRTRGCSCSSRSPRTHAVHALDLPGHGASDKDVGDGSLAALADVVVGFLDALGISRAHLVGHSLGGAVVAAVARSAPEKVASLTLLAPVGLRGRRRRGVPARVRGGGHPAGAQAAGRAAVRGPRRWSPASWSTTCCATSGSTGWTRPCPRCSARCSTATARRSTRRRCSTGVDVPVTVVWGSADRHPAAARGHRGAGGRRAHAAHGGGERRRPRAAGARGRMTSA